MKIQKELNEQQSKYVWDFFCNIYGLDINFINPSEFYKTNFQVHFIKSDIEEINTIHDYKINWMVWKDKKIPFLFSNLQDIIEYKNAQIILNFDLFRAVFFLISGEQEVDLHGNQFKIEHSIQHQLNISDLPLVNYYFDILATLINKSFGTDLRFTKHNYPYTVCLTHDIDNCETGWLEGGFAELKKFHLKNCFYLLSRKIINNDVWFNFQNIIDIEKEYQVNSTFFFLTRKKTKDLKNADYNIHSSKIRKAIKMIRNEGNEVALHGSIGSSRNHTLFQEDIQNIEKPVLGNRFHFLKWDAGLSPSILNDNNLLYDSTLGFSEKPGFRNSCCYPFYLWDFKNNKKTDVLEIPLVVMDTTFRQYLKIKPEEVNTLVNSIMDEIKKWQGNITLLWHNNYFSEYKFPKWKDAYCDLLTRFQHDEAYINHANYIREIYK